jgi:hypothetical protein
MPRPLHGSYGVLFIPLADDDLISKVISEMSRRGGQARANALTAKQRRDSAIKASRAAAKIRTRKAKKRKAEQ